MGAKINEFCLNFTHPEPDRMLILRTFAMTSVNLYLTKR